MWQNTVSAVSAVVLFGVAFGQARPDQPDAGRYYIPIWGRIMAYTGAPIQNQTVVLSGTGRESIKTQTDQDGKFRFPTVEGDKPASLQVDATDIPAVDLGVVKRGGDIGTVVLQLVGGAPSMEHFHPTTGLTQPLLSGRITDANGAPMAGKDLFFSNSRTSFFLRMDENGAFVCPPASFNEYEIYISESADPFAPNSKLEYVGNIALSDGQDVELGNVVLQQSASSKKGRWGDIAGRVTGHIAGSVTIAPLPPTPEPKMRSSVRTETAIAGIFCGADPASVIQEDGNVVRQPTEREQIGCSSPKIAADKRTAGWLVDSDFCCTSYPLQFMVVVYRPGKPLRRFTGDGRAIFGWTFVGGGREVAFYQSYPHGDPVAHAELRDVNSERLVGKWDGDTPKAPSWAQGLLGK
jgi:hypothetical protein